MTLPFKVGKLGRENFEILVLNFSGKGHGDIRLVAWKWWFVDEGSRFKDGFSFLWGI